MNAQHVGLVAGVMTLVGCASTDIAQKDTLNEPSDRVAASEDRMPPNPNRPTDSRELKAIPPVVQHDPALNQPKDGPAENKGLVVTPGADQLVRPQTPTQSEAAQTSVGTPAGAAQAVSVSKSDNELVTRIKDAISQVRNKATNIDAQATSEAVEAKTIPGLEVTAENGRVTLSGSVATETERTAMEQAATRVQGVVSVSNYITVSKSDKE